MERDDVVVAAFAGHNAAEIAVKKLEDRRRSDQTLEETIGHRPGQERHRCRRSRAT